MNDDNPDNAINRFEWMEAVVRIAAERYTTVPTIVSFWWLVVTTLPRDFILTIPASQT